MFKRVLVAMDLSPATETLVSALPGLKEMGTEEIALVHVAKPITHPVSQSLKRVDEVRKRLGSLRLRLEEEGFRTTLDVPTGSPVAEIPRVVAERHPDIIMVGSRSQSLIRDAFIGSVAWETVRRATRPVLLHRIEPVREDPEAALETRGTGLPVRVVHPTDFSPAAQRAFPWVERLARMGVRSFTLLHVLDPDDPDSRGEVEKGLQLLADQLKEAGASEVEVQVRRGSAADEVLARGGGNPDNMVVMGTQGRGFLPEIVMGSESRKVARRAAARVLLVPATVEEPVG